MFSNPRSWAALPLLMIGLSAATSPAAQVRDDAGMFGRQAVSEAQERLTQIEREYQVPVAIETVESLRGQDIDAASLQRAERSGSRGIYILFDKEGKKMEVRDFRNFLGAERRQAIRRAFTGEFKNGNFDAGLREGVGTIQEILGRGGGRLRPAAAHGPAPAPVGGARAGGGFGGLGGLIPIALGILGLFLVIRLLGRLFGSMGQPAGGRPPMGAPGGYGHPYGGGGGGGFFSSLFGGIGGAMAGNWLYDQFSGRHRDSVSNDYGSSSVDPSPDPGGDWGGGGEVGSWGGDGGGGGDWGGGDGGGGGDWGGGGDGGSW